MDNPLFRENMEKCLIGFHNAGGLRRFNRPARRRGSDALAMFVQLMLVRGDAPEDLSLEDVRGALIDAADVSNLNQAERRQWPAVAAAFLRWCADQGPMPRGRAYAFKLEKQTLPPPRPEFADLATPPDQRGQTETAAAALPHPRPNAPCPCGSGRKAKLCCYRYN